jgi:hypothetical protein
MSRRRPSKPIDDDSATSIYEGTRASRDTKRGVRRWDGGPAGDQGDLDEDAIACRQARAAEGARGEAALAVGDVRAVDQPAARQLRSAA